MILLEIDINRKKQSQISMANQVSYLTSTSFG